MALLIEFADIRKESLAQEDYVVFGGTFDPIHEGHISAVRLLLTKFSHIIIAPTSKNPWKSDWPTSVSMRREMIQILLNSERLSGLSRAVSKVIISEFEYVYSEELSNHLASSQKGKQFWVVGKDSANSVDKWRNWDSLNIPTIVVPIVINVHATEIRSGQSRVHPALRQYVVEHHLYGN